MAHFVLVHGAMHGAWCWHKLTPELRSLGHEATVLDLPGHGIDRTPLTRVTLWDHSQRVIEVVERLDTDVVLVGHSMGAAVISEASERLTERVSGLIYIAGVVCRPGESGLESLAIDTDSYAQDATMPGAGDGLVHPDKTEIATMYYHDCRKEDMELARSLLVPAQLHVLAPPLTTSEHGWGQIPQAYIQCTEDRALPYETQQDMAAHVGVDQIIEMASSHSPFLSMPRKLAEHMDSIVRTLP